MVGERESIVSGGKVNLESELQSVKQLRKKNNFGKLDESNRRTNEGENIDINDHPSIFWSILRIMLFD